MAWHLRWGKQRIGRRNEECSDEIGADRWRQDRPTTGTYGRRVRGRLKVVADDFRLVTRHPPSSFVLQSHGMTSRSAREHNGNILRVPDCLIRIYAKYANIYTVPFTWRSNNATCDRDSMESHFVQIHRGQANRIEKENAISNR